jgi:prepilin-type N-terminal cleavage/methylation domain-containing protein
MNLINRKIKAFTLIELLVVIAIVGILSGLIVVSMNGSINSANDAKRKANIDAIRKAIIVYGTLNGGVYPTGIPEAAGCNIGPVSILNRCANFASALSELLPVLPIDPVSGYYTYISNGTSFSVSSNLSSGKAHGYSSSAGFYSSIFARASTYKNLTMTGTPIDDSANNAIFGSVIRITAPSGWGQDGYVYSLNSASGFTPGEYDIYVRARCVSGTYYNISVLDSVLSEWPCYYAYLYPSTTYTINYAYRMALTPSNIANNAFSFFRINTADCYFDYVEFRKIRDCVNGFGVKHGPNDFGYTCPP